MCEKQCRDANGFKCHLTSESHLRMMRIFSERAGTYMDRYSREFEKSYLDTLRLRHSTSRTNANHVYQQVIQDKHHVHMNATVWASLTDFCQYLGRTGQCVVDETDQGWYVTYVERNAAKVQAEARTAQRRQADEAAERATHERLQKQRIAAAHALDRAGGVVHVPAATPLERPPVNQTNDDDDDDHTANDDRGNSKRPTTTHSNGIHFAVLHTSTASGRAKAAKAKKKNQKPSVPILGKSVLDEDDSDQEEHHQHDHETSPEPTPAGTKNQPQRINHHPTMAAAAAKKDQREEEDDDQYYYDYYGQCGDEIWVCPGILVRVIDDRVDGGSWFRHKAVVDQMSPGCTVAHLTLLAGDGPHHRGVSLRLGATSLETVAPKHAHATVRLVRGPHRGALAWVVQLDPKRCRASLQLRDGTVLRKVDYDDFSLLP